MLLDAGADVDDRTRGDHSTPMLVAIINGNYDLAMMLLERGANPNLASEDGARLQAMSAADHNIGDKLEKLKRT